MPTIRITPTPAPQTPKLQGFGLAWSEAAQASIADILARYPKEHARSAVIPLLHLAQREFGGWVSVDAMELVAQTLGLPYIRVYEVATFYTMFNLNPVGKYHLQVCTNCSCLIRGSESVLATLEKVLGIKPGETTEDGRFTLTEVECLGACVSAPVMQTTYAEGGAHYFTQLDAEKTRKILHALMETGSAAQLADTPPADIDPITHREYGL